MKLYEEKKQINLSDALAVMFGSDTPHDNFEFMIDFDEVDRLVAFGKTWTKKDPTHYGVLVPKYWIHQEYCPVVSYDEEDLFLIDLFNDSYMKKYFNQKRFHVWKKISN